MMWAFLYRDHGSKKYATLGPCAATSKSEAQEKADAIIAEANVRNASAPDRDITLGKFLEAIALPFMRGKWKKSTAATTENRITHHLDSEYGEKRLRDLTVTELQEFLVVKAGTFSRSIVAHLRWDLRSSER